MKRIKPLFYLILICLNPVVNLAQDQDILWYNKIDETNNLSSGEHNYYHYHDSEGFVWISSINGLNRFNGNKAKQYHPDPHDSTSLADKFIQSTFFEDSNKDLWFVTYTAIHRYNRKQDNFDRFWLTNDEGKKITDNYKAFHLERDSFLWVYAEPDIYRVNIRDPQKTEHIAQSNFVHHFVGVDSLGFLSHIFSLDNKNVGLNLFTLKNNQITSKQYFPFIDPLKKDSIEFRQALFENPENIWLTSNRGLIKWNAIQDTFYILNRMKNAYGSVIKLDQENLLLSMANNQLYKVNKKELSLSPYLLKPVDNPLATSFDHEIRHLSLDREKVLWMTAHPNGIIYTHLEKNKFKSIPRNVIPNLGPDFKFENFIETDDGKIWAFHNQGLAIFSPDKQLIRSISCPTIYYNCEFINHGFKDQDGKIWVALDNGIAYFDNKKNGFQFLPSSKGHSFLYIYQLKNGTLLGSTLNKGLFEISSKKDKWTLNHISKEKGYTTIFEDRLNQIYVNKQNSSIDVFALKEGAIIKQDSLDIHTPVNCFYESNDEKTLWIGTSIGLGKFDKNNLHKVIQYSTTKDSLPSNNILGIIPHNKHELLLSTDNGLAFYNIKTKSVKSFSLEDGMLSNQFSEYAFLKLKNGETWFGGPNGITIVPEKVVSSFNINSQIIFSDIKINGEIRQDLYFQDSITSNINQIKEINLDYTQNSISIQFRATDYSAPNNTQIRYKLELEGDNDNWAYTEKGESGSILYPQLNPGKYTFIAQGANGEGQWGIARIIQIEILPPIWKTWWFISLAILAGLGLILFLAKLRINQIQKTSDLKTKIAENKMAALVAQMNPHFIFNSLQSINSYILKNDKQQASEYLGRFSKLMRMILENSRNSTHPLQQEIDLLNLYLKVEAQRFKIPFEHSIIIDENIDPYETLIPAMMLQPFIENAIWHGISHKTETGQIKVTISSKNNLLKCAVEDNGVGRKKAAEISIQKRKSHTSRATEIITDRLKLLFPNDHDRCTIEYIDLFDENQNPTGTRVEIDLPFLDDA